MRKNLCILLLIMGVCLVSCEKGNNEPREGTYQISGTENNHDYVDLGLSVKWATCNVGASNPEDYGNYFAWGETNGNKVDYSARTYKYYVDIGYIGITKITKYCCVSNKYGNVVDNKTILEKIDDAAYINWKGNWRMPTYEELNELKTQCSWKWTTLNGINGCKVSGKNGNAIFLPAAGNHYHSTKSEFVHEGSVGTYWSSTLYTSSPYAIDNDSRLAWVINFADFGKISVHEEHRENGFSVRPVCP